MVHYKRKKKRPQTQEPITGYLDRQSRLDYLQQKLAAEVRMRVYDDQEPEIRMVQGAAGTIGNTAVLWRVGCRTFEQAEKAMAGVWDGDR